MNNAISVRHAAGADHYKSLRFGVDDKSSALVVFGTEPRQLIAAFNREFWVSVDLVELADPLPDPCNAILVRHAQGESRYRSVSFALDDKTSALMIYADPSRHEVLATYNPTFWASAEVTYIDPDEVLSG